MRSTIRLLSCLSCWALSISAMALSASAQGTSADPPPSDAETVPMTEPEGLIPIPDYNGDLLSRRALTGDWGGWRTNLARRGLTLDLAFSQIGQGVVDGGRDTGWAYGGKLDTFLTLDLQRMGLLPGALVTMRTESRYGESVNKNAGTLLPVNDVLYFPLTDTIDEDLPITITELRYVQFLSRYFGVFAGKFTTLGGDANEFAGGRGDTQFISHTFLGASVTALINPYSTLGAGVIINPTERISFTSSVYSATDSSTDTGFGDLGDGWVSSSILRGQYRIGDLPGGMLAAFQYSFDNDYADFKGQFVSSQGVELPLKHDSWNVFWNGWQYLYVEKSSEELINVTDGRTDLQGIGIFARAATADADTNPVKWVVSGGVGGKGVIPGRDHDTFGIGYGYSKIKTAPFVTGRVLENSSARFEAYYTLSLMRSVELTFDAQLADSIRERQDPAWLVGGRLRLAL